MDVFYLDAAVREINRRKKAEIFESVDLPLMV